MDEVAVALRFGVAFTLLWSGAAKSRSIDAFASSIDRLAPAAYPYSHRVATLVVLAEIAFGALSLLGIQYGLLGAAGLFAVFAIATASAFARGIRGTCACFGGADENLSIVTSVRAGGLATLAIVAASLGSSTLTTGPALLAAVTGAGVSLIVRLLPDLPVALAFLQQSAPDVPTTRRQSFRYLSPGDSLFGLSFDVPMNQRPTPRQLQNGG
jgi:hypothetical protein